MGRPKKSTTASRNNGSMAKNKGKAKTTVPVLSCTYDLKEQVYTVTTDKRAPLPKGYVAYESELATHTIAIDARLRAGCEDVDAKDKMAQHRLHARICRKAECKALKMCADSKGQDVDAKLSSLKALTDGANVAFAFKKSVDDRPRRGQRRAA